MRILIEQQNAIKISAVLFQKILKAFFAHKQQEREKLFFILPPEETSRPLSIF